MKVNRITKNFLALILSSTLYLSCSSTKDDDMDSAGSPSPSITQSKSEIKVNITGDVAKNFISGGPINQATVSNNNVTLVNSSNTSDAIFQITLPTNLAVGSYTFSSPELATSNFNYVHNASVQQDPDYIFSNAGSYPFPYPFSIVITESSTGKIKGKFSGDMKNAFATKSIYVDGTFECYYKP